MVGWQRTTEGQETAGVCRQKWKDKACGQNQQGASHFSWGGHLWNSSGSSERHCGIYICIFPERTGGASERASDHRRPAAADDDALPQEAGRAQGEEKARLTDEEIRHHLPFALGAPSWLFLCNDFRNWRKLMMIPTWIHSGQTDKLWGNSFKASPTSNGVPDESRWISFFFQNQDSPR